MFIDLSCEYLSEWSSWKSHGFSYVAKIFRESEFLFYILNFTVLSSSPRHIIVTLHNVTHLDFWYINISSKCFLKNWMFIHLFPTTTHVISCLFLFRNEVMMLILLQFFHSLHLSLNRKRMKRKREKDQKRVSHWKNWLKEYQHVVFLSLKLILTWSYLNKLLHLSYVLINNMCKVNQITLFFFHCRG